MNGQDTLLIKKPRIAPAVSPENIKSLLQKIYLKDYKQDRRSPGKGVAADVKWRRGDLNSRPAKAQGSFLHAYQPFELSGLGEDRLTSNPKP